MADVGFRFSSQAIRRQLAAMPNDTYLIRLIHHVTRRPCSGERIWPATQILREPTIRFLRARNREGFDVYFRPYALDHNAGYILVDLDCAQPAVLTAMRDNRHEPCTVIETSPGHLQAWIRVSLVPLPPPLATPISRHLARLYQGDLARADWRHLGRLAGFTNQKPQRRLPSGLPPWVKIHHAAAGLASNRQLLLESVLLESMPFPFRRLPPNRSLIEYAVAACKTPAGLTLPTAEAVAIYQTCLHQLRIPQRFSQPDWSIADLWIAKQLLCQGVPAARVISIIALASPQFPRRHSDPEDYLQRTLKRAAQDLARHPFPARASAWKPPT
jgi:hypothetical protein